MKHLIRPVLIIILGIALALMSTALIRSVPPREGSNLAAAAFFLQTTPTPEQVDRSEIGSTDGIVVMGFVLVAIVILPILLRKKAWSQTQ